MINELSLTVDNRLLSSHSFFNMQTPTTISSHTLGLLANR